MNPYNYYNPASVSVPMALYRTGEKEPTLLELVRRDREYATERGFNAPSAVELMREGIADGNSYPMPGKGNRARRRAAVIGMQSHNRLWMHLNCA